MGCGCRTDDSPRTSKAETTQLLNTLSQRIHTNAIIWIVIGALQIMIGIFCIVGILNIVSAINDMKYSKEILNDPTDIVEKFEPVTMPIIVSAYNLVFGGIVGVVGSIYYFISIRGFVMENKERFSLM
ncbi:MAG: hypothetical protein IJB24_05425 [Clostridia bacterium]|nr:hypothetical protein [Clostridia bacterium]MBQ4602286.1 hypothetical protein [Clostridia bacterium]